MSLDASDWITIGFSLANILLAISVFIYTWYTNKIKGPRISVVEYIPKVMTPNEIKINFRYVNSGDTLTVFIFTGYLIFQGKPFASSVINKEAIAPIKEIAQNHVHFKTSLPKSGIDLDSCKLKIEGYFFDHNGKKKSMQTEPIALNEIKQ